MAYIGTPPADRVLSSADIAQGAVTLNDINFTDVPTNMDITGTIDKHTMRLAEGVTITGDVTISDDLVLAKISDDGVAITMTPDGSSRTITGSGSIQAATIAATPQPTQTYEVGATLTGLTGVIGSEVTGGAGLSPTIASNSITLAKMASNSVDSDQYVDGSIDSAHIADDQVTLAKMAGGTDGQIITYDASGDPVAVGPGTDGQVLTSTGAGSPPAFEDAGGGGGAAVVWAGWNAYDDTTEGSWVSYPLDVDRIAINTTYMTKSSSVFTCVTAGSYLVNLNTISQVGGDEYVRHRMEKNSDNYIHTNGSGSSTSNMWTDYSYSVVVNLVATDTIEFNAKMWGGTYLWHANLGGFPLTSHDYSQLNITFLHA